MRKQFLLIFVVSVVLSGCGETSAAEDLVSSESSLGSVCAAPNWVQGKAYAAGDVVKYTDGKRYTAKFANPGYNPTISTYYWAPFAGYPAWNWRVQYAVGDVVKYTDGNLYITVVANPGYDPTISTYFWDPFACSVVAQVPPPVISAVAASDVTQTGAVISWTLNEPGTGRIEYGTTTAYGNVRTPEEFSFTYSGHVQALSGLTAGTRYHYRVTSRNQAGGTTSSADNTFTTSSAAPAPTGGNLPAKVVAGYFTTWEPRNGVTLRSIADSTNYNLVYVSFAVGLSASSGTLRLDLPPGATSATDFKNQIAYANARGKKVVVSVGGYFDLGNSNIGYRLDSTAKVDQFMASMRDFQANWGFNGMDWDLEQGDRPDVAGIVAASRRMRAEFGPTWIINFAPGPELNTWIGPGGVLEQLGPNGWDAIGEQIYDLGLSSQAAYQARIVARMTALTNKYGAAKVLLGNKYRPDSPSTWVDPISLVHLSTTTQALSQLRGAGINIRGSFVWTIQSDSDQSFAWANTVGADILSHP